MKLAVCVLAALAFAATALADGDPASDYLVYGDVYLPYPPPSSSSQLQRAVAAVNAGPGRVKVAVIAQPSDLGSVPSLFGHPADYAKFLGTELHFFYRGALLVVMPAGFGFYKDGATSGPSLGAPADTSADGLTEGAAAAVGVLRRSGSLAYRDTTKPTAIPVSNTVTAGKRSQLVYRATDDSGRAAIVLTVLQGSRTLVTFSVPTRQVAPGALYRVSWSVRAAEAGKTLAFCARATDPSGNRSATTCRKLSVP